MSWLTTMTWYQQGACAFFLGLLPLVLIGILLGHPWDGPGGNSPDYSWMVNMFRRTTYCDPPVYGWRDYVRIFWAGRRWRHWWPFESMYLEDCRCTTCLLYFTAKKGLGGMNSGSSSGSGGSFQIRCASCYGPITGGLCSNCGPAAGIQYVASAVGGGGGGGQGGSSSVQFASGGFVATGPGGGGGGGYVSPFTLCCGTCSTPIPSGVCCSISCLQMAMPNLYTTTGGGCMDCGSGLAPTYHAGCQQSGRVTQYLPIPGPYGSNGLTQAQAAQGGPAATRMPRKPIPVSGMTGYSEHGTPEDWDLAIGTIRGYRWFKIEIPESWTGVRNRQVRQGYYDANGKLEVTDEGMLELSDNELPCLFGAFGGQWDDGVNEARCRRSMATRPGNRFHHEPPEIREACGCGFWAYFDENLPCSQVLSQWSQGGLGMRGIAVLGCVEGSGRVIVGEKGFRSQYAKIAALTIGQVSVPGLMYWTDTSQTGYGRGPGGSYGAPHVQCSDEELYGRLAKIEDMLSRKYPSARVVSSENNLRGLFPPDKNYGAM